MSESTAPTSEPRPLPNGAEEVIRFSVEHPELFDRIAETTAEERRKAGLRRSQGGDYANELMRQARLLLMPGEPFEVGQLVKWKAGLKNRRKPAYDEPAVVLDVYEKPFFSGDDDPSSAYFREPLDIVLGILDRDDELIYYHFDSRRFEHFPGQSDAHTHGAR